MDALAPTLVERYTIARERVREAARRAGQSPDSVVLVAVTKYADPDQIRELITLGHHDFGENRVQQLVQRAAIIDESLGRQRTALPRGEAPPSVRWHMIGHLQRNKARKVVEFARLIHTVDSLRLAEELQQIALKRDEPIEVLVQVNCAGEREKHGCAVPAAFPLVEQIETMVHVRVRGLMTMAPLSHDPENARPTFRRCRELFEEIASTGIGDGRFNLLSMGMSGDYEVAIAEGANLVRIGTAIFGEPRPEQLQEAEA